MKSQTTQRRIALALPPGLSFVERILKSFLEYSRKRGWTFVRIPERVDSSVEWLRDCGADGALVMVSDEEAAETVRSLQMPAVNLSAYLDPSDLPTVMVDQKEIGNLAAQHLMGRYLSRFAYYGTSDLWYSRVRRQSFVESVEAAGGECQVLEVGSIAESGEGYRMQRELLDHWLRTLRTPVGIMASTDMRARMVAQACAQAGLRIPEDVALIGVDNDFTVQLHDPPVSSISRNDSEVGMRAAELLDRLMDGGLAPTEPILVRPDGVISRYSTDLVTITRSHIARAVKFIQTNIHKPFGMTELLDIASMPRASFDRHFEDIVGISPRSFIDRCRVERATTLLISMENRPLTEIASLSGFCDSHHFRQVFRRLLGMPPSAYLRRKRNGGLARSKERVAKTHSGRSRIDRLSPC